MPLLVRLSGREAFLLVHECGEVFIQANTLLDMCLGDHLDTVYLWEGVGPLTLSVVDVGGAVYGVWPMQY